MHGKLFDGNGEIWDFLLKLLIQAEFLGWEWENVGFLPEIRYHFRNILSHKVLISSKNYYTSFRFKAVN